MELGEPGRPTTIGSHVADGAHGENKAGSAGFRVSSVACRRHQRYLLGAKNPNGYYGMGGIGVSWPVGVTRADG